MWWRDSERSVCTSTTRGRCWLWFLSERLQDAQRLETPAVDASPDAWSRTVTVCAHERKEYNTVSETNDTIAVQGVVCSSNQICLRQTLLTIFVSEKPFGPFQSAFSYLLMLSLLTHHFDCKVQFPFDSCFCPATIIRRVCCWCLHMQCERTPKAVRVFPVNPQMWSSIKVRSFPWVMHPQ